jgi:hypothetical protein
VGNAHLKGWRRGLAAQLSRDNPASPQSAYFLSANSGLLAVPPIMLVCACIYGVERCIAQRAENRPLIASA